MTVDLATLTADEAERLVAMCEAIDSGALGVQLDDFGSPQVVANVATEPALIFAYSTKAAVLAAAKEVATLHGRPKPRSAAAAASDPVLAALLLASTSSTNQQKADQT